MSRATNTGTRGQRKRTQRQTDRKYREFRKKMEVNPHGALFHALMDDPRRAQSMILDYLPPQMRQDFEDTLPRLIEGTFIDEELRSSQSDRLFEVDLKGGETALVYTLLTDQADRLMALRLSKYRVRIWERYVSENPTRYNLPVVIPMAFYIGDAPWNAPLSMAELTDHDTEHDCAKFHWAQ